MSLMDLVKKKRAELKAGGRQERPVKPAPGKSRWRILPSWKGADQEFWRDFGQHWIKQLGGGEAGRDKILAVYTCDAITNGERCEVCEAIANAKLMGDDDMIKTLDEARPQPLVLFNALHLDGDDPTMPKVLALTRTTAEQVFDLLEEYGADLVDLDAGTDLVIERKGSGLETKYNVMPAAKSKPVDASVMTRLHDLDAYVIDTEEGKVKALSAVGVVSGRAPMISATPMSSARALPAPGPEIDGKAELSDEDLESLDGMLEDSVDASSDDDPYATAAPAAPKSETKTEKPKAAPADAPTTVEDDKELEAMLDELA